MASDKQDLNLDIFENSTVAYSIIELVLDQDGHPADWIYRYCNQAFADLKGYRRDAMIDHSFLSLYPRIDREWLNTYYQAAYENKISEMDLIIDGLYHAVVAPTGQKGFCFCQLYAGKENSQEQEKSDPLAEERQVLGKLLPEYVSLYRIDLNSGKYEILRLAENTNARQLADQAGILFPNYDEYARYYADAFIQEADRAEFIDWHCCANMKKRFCETEKLTYHYHSVSRDGKDSYYEAYAVKGQINEEKYDIFLGYRNIDSILYKEKDIQRQLQNALHEARLSNEIIAAIAKAYQYISRIDIQADRFEEIVNRNQKQLNFIKSGILSENNKLACRQYVAEEYQEAFFKFTDISTLAERTLCYTKYQ